ncbi:hypothetical protein HED49_05495 [Ochrobactrum daejeonense]|nr:hypothetical protein [Brucella daejeonensis]
MGLNAAFRSMIFHGRGDIDEDTFQKFSSFLKIAGVRISRSGFSGHHLEIFNAVMSGNYSLFLDSCKPRLLISGYDLKFILSSLEALKEYFNIRIDEWKGHEAHDEKQSRQLLQWAEYVWCEWLLGNAVWYSRNVRDDQKLVIRMHRMELERNAGDSLKLDAVNSIVTVSVLFLRGFCKSLNPSREIK